MCSPRASTILAADQVLVLDEGRLVDAGNHVWGDGKWLLAPASPA
jgi:ABC-type transport system involved in Fe-S cluster assembly fused permease/ATPase subunit